MPVEFFSPALLEERHLVGTVNGVTRERVLIYPGKFTSVSHLVTSDGQQAGVVPEAAVLEYVDLNLPLSDQMIQRRMEEFTNTSSGTKHLSCLKCWIWYGFDGSRPEVRTRGDERTGRSRYDAVRTSFPYGAKLVRHGAGVALPLNPPESVAFMDGSSREGDRYCASNWRNFVVWFPITELRPGEAIVVHSVVNATEMNVVYSFQVMTKQLPHLKEVLLHAVSFASHEMFCDWFNPDPSNPPPLVPAMSR